MYKGHFDDTMFRLRPPIDVALLDVDLVSSTRSCLRQIFPNLRSTGVVLSQDGHLQSTVDLVSDASFWRDEVGVEPPRIDGLGADKLLELQASPPVRRF